MRIHRLEITAFGPFAQRQVIDFEELNQEGLFLLNGPTGSGKSSILDAISFALYGSTPSGRDKLKSTFADPQDVPRVVLDFSVQGRRLRVDRSPAYTRPVKRRGGAEWTEENAKASLQELDAQGNPLDADPISTRVNETNINLREIMGLDASQFNQVMLLPQGKFQAFLNAKSDEREKILKKLFGTLEFQRVQEILKEEAKELREKKEDKEKAQGALLAELGRLEDQAKLADLAQVLGQGYDPESSDFLTTVEDFQRSLTQRTQALAQQLTQVREEREKTKSLLEAWKEKEQLQAEAQELAAQKEEREEEAQALADHDRAFRLLPVIKSQQEAQQRFETSSQKVTRAKAEAQDLLETARRVLSPAALEVPWLEQVGAQLEASASLPSGLLEGLEKAQKQLEAYQQQETELARQSRDLETEKAKLPQLKDRLAVACTRLAETKAELDRQQAEISRYQETDLEVHRAQEAHQAARQLQEEAKKLAELEEKIPGQQQLLLAAEEDRQAAQDRYEQLNRIRLENLTASLAQDLIEGSPCLVCGSTQHPQPAQAPAGGQEIPSQQQIQQVQQERDQAENRRKQLETDLVSLQTRRDDLKGREVPPLSQAQAALKQAQEAQKQALKEQETARDLARQVEKQTQTLEEARVLKEQAKSQLEKQEARLSTLQKNLLNLETALPQQTEESAYGQRAQALSDLLKTCQNLGHLEGALEAARQEHKAKTHQLGQVLEEAQLASAQAAQELILTEAEEKRLKQELKDYQTRLEVNQKGAESTAQKKLAAYLAAGGSQPRPEDLTRLTEEETNQQKIHDSLLGKKSQLKGLLGHYRQVAEQQESQALALAQLEEKYELVAALSQVANGGRHEGDMAMTLQTYVLTSQFIKVTQAASEHLLAMTNKRYSLSHSDEKVKGQQRNGLNLAVYDRWTDKYRLPISLSGGESFMASFALALGLAEVVKSQQGGIEIDTLFVDEGFGSLDDETLDTVMSTIDNLREGGRVVGLISHVTEMKTRISKHLTLVKSRQGSTIKS